MPCSPVRIAAGVMLAVVLPNFAFAQATTGQPPPEAAPMHEMAHPHHPQTPKAIMAPGARAAMHADEAVPTMAGQGAFGAIQEIVRLLEADANTDWSKVDMEALRQHLIDMNEVTLKADAAMKQIDGGVEIAVTGTGRTLAAIQRMLPAHAHEINGHNGWTIVTRQLPEGVLLTATARDPKEIQHIRGLGFIGLLAIGAHHQPHHLAIARGEPIHTH